MKLGIFDILTIVFVVAKLVGWVDWPWWVVLAPTIVSLGLILASFVFILAGSALLKVRR